MQVENMKIGELYIHYTKKDIFHILILTGKEDVQYQDMWCFDAYGIAYEHGKMVLELREGMYFTSSEWKNNYWSDCNRIKVDDMRLFISTMFNVTGIDYL